MQSPIWFYYIQEGEDISTADISKTQQLTPNYLDAITSTAGQRENIINFGVNCPFKKSPVESGKP